MLHPDGSWPARPAQTAYLITSASPQQPHSRQFRSHASHSRLSISLRLSGSGGTAVPLIRAWVLAITTTGLSIALAACGSAGSLPPANATPAASASQTTALPSPTATVLSSPAAPKAPPPRPPTNAPPPPANAPPPPTNAAPPPTNAPPPPPAGCYPLSDEGTCYKPGEFCRDSDHGMTGRTADGEQIICENNDGWRWEPA